jgi:maleate isomerase
MWQPDGWDAKARIGVLTPHADVGPESELQAMAPDGVVVHAARVPFGAMSAGGGMDSTIPLAPVRAFADPPHVDTAAELLAAAPVQAIGFGFTSSGYVIGADGEAAMVARLEARTRGIRVVSTCAAAVAGLRVLEVERLAVVAPPWFDAELTELGGAYFRAAGFDVVLAAACDLPSDQRAINPPELYDWVLAHVPEHAQGVFLGGNGFRAVGAIDALEQQLGVPVLTANQVLLWQTLLAAGIADPVSGYGRLFEAAPTVP